MEIMRRLVQEEEGQGLVEYVMIVAVVVAIAVAVSGSGLGDYNCKLRLTNLINTVAD